VIILSHTNINIVHTTLVLVLGTIQLIRSKALRLPRYTRSSALGPGL
jgi:hypothetical protein